MMIDVFNHFMPKAYLDRLGDLIPGHPVLTAFPRLKTLWDVDARRSLLDEFPGTQHVLSLANPPPELIGPPDKTPELVRMANDALAEICRKHPEHFPAFIASLPMNDVEASVKEPDRAVKAARRPRRAGVHQCRRRAAVGASIPAGVPVHGPARSCRGASDARRAVFGLRQRAASQNEIWFSFGWPYETTACMTRLIYSGILDEWPTSKIISHHMGGMIPYFSGKIKLGFRQIFFGHAGDPTRRRSRPS